MRLEEDFVQAMDAVQEYLELQSAIESQLRHGFMHLSIARYASGSNRISLLQIPSRLTAQTRFGGDIFLEVEKCEAMGPSGAEVNNDELLKTKTSHNEGLESDLIAELSRKYECDFERSIADEKEGQEGQYPAKSPLYWFGNTVPPALHDAKNAFDNALRLMTKLAKVRRRLSEIMAKE